MTSPEPTPAHALELLGGLTVRQAQAERARVLTLGAHYRQATGVPLHLDPELAGRLAYERGTRTLEVGRDGHPPSAERDVVADVEAALELLGAGRPASSSSLLPLPLDETTLRGIHSTEGEARTARRIAPSPHLDAPLTPFPVPPACNAPGSLGRHPIPAGAPAACPCGRVRRYPPQELRP